MRKFTKEDLEEIKNVFVMLNKVHFKEINIKEMLAVVGLRKWLSDLYLDIEAELKPDIKTKPVKLPVKKHGQNKKVKKAKVAPKPKAN